MIRLLTITAVVFGMVCEATADVPPPPPPPGMKFVSVSNLVRLAQEIDGYVFVVAHGVGPGPPRYSYKKITLSTKSSTSMPGGGRYQYIQLLAVPSDAAEKVLAEGPGVPPVNLSEIKGLHRLGFADTATIDAKHAGNSVTRTHTITGFDKNGGIQTTVEREPADVEGDKKKNSRAEVGPGGTSTAVAGIALALSIVVGGIWLARSRRAKPSAAALM